MQKIKKGLVDSSDSRFQNQQKNILFHVGCILGVNYFSWDILDIKFYMGLWSS